MMLQTSLDWPATWEEGFGSGLKCWVMADKSLIEREDGLNRLGRSNREVKGMKIKFN